MYELVDNAVLKKVRKIRDKNIPVCGSTMQQKTLNFTKELWHSNFKAIVEWLHKFKKRHNIRYKTVSGEIANVSEEVCEKWKKKASKFLEEFPAKSSFNTDETGQFF